MENEHSRLRTARENSGFASAADASRRFGWTTSTYAGHENGSRGIRPSAAKKYAKAFKVSVEWLTFGTGTPTATPPKPNATLRGFSEPAAEPVSNSNAIKIRAFQSKLDNSPQPNATPFKVSRNFLHLGIIAGDIIFVNMQAAPKAGDIVLANQVDTITATGTTMIRQFAGDLLIGGPDETPADLKNDILVVGVVESVIRLKTGI